MSEPQKNADKAPDERFNLTLQWIEGLRRCAGALANEWTDEDDRILEEIYQSRKLNRRRLPEELDHDP